VSASIAHLFSQHAANYQAVAAQAVAFSDQFVQHLKTGAGSYAGAEAAAAASLQPLTAPAATLPTLPDVLNLLSQLAADPLLILAILASLSVVAIFFGPILLYALLGLLLSLPGFLWSQFLTLSRFSQRRELTGRSSGGIR
jgi:hypothetical protein